MTKYFKTTLLFLILAEIFSFCAFLYPIFNKICFLTIIILAVILTFEKLEYGVYLLFAELFIGSFGYLFFYEAGGMKLSLRIGLFLAVFSIWCAKLITGKKRLSGFFENCKNNKFIKWYLLLFVFLILGFSNGLLRGNSFSNIFFDANSYIYFALIFPLADVIRNKEQVQNIYALLIATSAVIAAKSLFLLFIFSHKMHYVMGYLYTWMRDFRLGELTVMQGGFYRIFSQSHIYALIALFFVVLGMMNNERSYFFRSPLEGGQGGVKPFINGNGFFAYVLFLTVIILGMSRSFWVGGLAALIALYSWLIFRIRKFMCHSDPACCGGRIPWRERWTGYSALIQGIPRPPPRIIAGRGSRDDALLHCDYAQKHNLKFLAKFTGALILGFIISVVLLFVIVKFPYPKETVYFSTDLFKERAVSVNDEAGSSRWNLLPVLTKEILESPILGSGFGTTVTYKSNDPRVIASSPTGEYTTYAFEWGYLDIILKIGILGMSAYLWIVWKVWREGWQYIRSCDFAILSDAGANPAVLRDKINFAKLGDSSLPSHQKVRCPFRMTEMEQNNARGNVFMTAGLMLGLIVILATSVFSPYMNHPIGIGYILLATVAIPIL